MSAAFDSAIGDPDQTKYEANFQNVCKVMNDYLPWGTLWVTQRFGIASTNLKDFYWIPAPGGGPYESHPENWDIMN